MNIADLIRKHKCLIIDKEGGKHDGPLEPGKAYDVVNRIDYFVGGSPNDLAGELLCEVAQSSSNEVYLTACAGKEEDVDNFINTINSSLSTCECCASLIKVDTL